MLVGVLEKILGSLVVVSSSGGGGGRSSGWNSTARTTLGNGSTIMVK